MLRKNGIFRKRTLLDDLEKLIKKIAGNDSHGAVLLTMVKDGHFDNDVNIALKLRDDINGVAVTYTDADFLRCRNQHRTNPIGKLLQKHKDNLPPCYVKQRANVSDAHLDGVLNGTEQEQNYGYDHIYFGVKP